MHTQKDIINRLLDKGVKIPCPESVEIGPEVDPARISGENVTIHTGCKLYGEKTLIMPGVTLGEEAPASVRNCQLAKNVKLKGGCFFESCFLEGAAMGSGAQIREACLLEEGAGGAHCVGLKHTILLPFVTLGSLINFCDCLMAGGTDKKNHSEVGSSYIHFNYTPNQDKATASLIGDVPKGVMVNQKPIFLGGQGGLVGPVKIGYGVVVGAGNVVRKDILEPDTLLVGQAPMNMTIPFTRGLYINFVRIISRNTEYIANLIALRSWYRNVRSQFTEHLMDQALWEGALGKLDMAVSERIKRLAEVAERMPRSIEIQRNIARNPAQKSAFSNQQTFYDKWSLMAETFHQRLDWDGDASPKEAFLKILEKAIARHGRNYLGVIKGLSPDEADTGTFWLNGIVDTIKKDITAHLPKIKKYRN